jgi:hypothetical protein
VQRYIEDGVIKIQFVFTMDNKADVFTKNTKSESFVSVMDYMMD